MPISTSDTAKAFVKDRARALGFDAVAVTRVDEAWTAGERLQAFVEGGRHGTMDWMETTLERRKAPTAMWPDATLRDRCGSELWPGS